MSLISFFLSFLSLCSFVNLHFFFLCLLLPQQGLMLAKLRIRHPSLSDSYVRDALANCPKALLSGILLGARSVRGYNGLCSPEIFGIVDDLSGDMHVFVSVGNVARLDLSLDKKAFFKVCWPCVGLKTKQTFCLVFFFVFCSFQGIGTECIEFKEVHNDNACSKAVVDIELVSDADGVQVVIVDDADVEDAETELEEVEVTQVSVAVRREV